MESGHKQARDNKAVEPLNINLNDTMTAARFPIKQCSIAVVISGLEKIQNSGESAMMNLIKARVDTAERTFWNQMSAGVYSDGTGFGGKQIGGLASIISKVPTVGVVGGIDAAANPWWQNYALDQTTDTLGAITSTNIQAYMNKASVNVKRNSEGLDLYVADNNLYLLYLQSLQAIQRITEGGGTKVGAGFTALKYFGAGKSVDVILDGGKGGQIPANTMYGINSQYLYCRPSSERNFDVIGGDRANVNQDAIIRLYGWAGNMTVSNRSLQAVIF